MYSTLLWYARDVRSQLVIVVYVVVLVLCDLQCLVLVAIVTIIYGGRTLNTIETITDLLEPERTTLYKLSKLTYKGLRNNKLVFTYDEMKEVCAEIDKSDIHGSGLMQTVECYCHKGAGKSISLNFLHFTMQEYLAALHVSSLPSEEQLLLIEELFWDRQFSFMWIMYIGIEGTQLTSFIKSVIFKPLDEQQNHTLHDGEYNILARKNLFLFQCCLEGKDVDLVTARVLIIKRSIIPRSLKFASRQRCTIYTI